MPAWKPLLRLRHGAGGKPQGRAPGRRSGSITSFEDKNPFDGGTVVARARHRRRQGAAHRQGLRRAWTGRRTGRATTTSRPTSTPTPRAAGAVRRGPRHGHPRLLDARELQDGRPAGREHAGHPDRAALRGREIAARPAADAQRRSRGWSSRIGDKPPRRRCSSTTSAWSATTETRQVAFRRPLGLRLRHRRQPGDGRLHAASRRQRSTARAAATAGRTPASGGPSTPCSPTRSTRTSSASSAADWRSTCPTASTASWSTSTTPSGFWGEYQVYRTAGASCPKASRRRGHDGLRRLHASSTSASGTSRTCPTTTRSTSTRSLLPGEEVRRRGDGRAAERRFPGRELGLLRVGRRGLSRSTRRPRASGSSTIVEQRRRFYFDNYFKRVLHPPTGDPGTSRPAKRRGPRLRCLPARLDEDVYYNDRPRSRRDCRQSLGLGVCRRIRAGDLSRLRRCATWAA